MRKKLNLKKNDTGWKAVKKRSQLFVRTFHCPSKASSETFRKEDNVLGFESKSWSFGPFVSRQKDIKKNKSKKNNLG